MKMLGSSPGVGGEKGLRGRSSLLESGVTSGQQLSESLANFKISTDAGL